MSRGNLNKENIRQAKQYSQNSTNSYDNQQIQPQQQQPQSQPQQSSDQLEVPEATRRALEAIKRARAQRSDFMILEAGITYRLQFDPSKSKPETKTFNGQESQRVSHSVTNLNDLDGGEKILSLTFKQSQPIENAMADGYTVMDVMKIGEGFSLAYQVIGIE